MTAPVTRVPVPDDVPSDLRRAWSRGYIDGSYGDALGPSYLGARHNDAYKRGHAAGVLAAAALRVRAGHTS